jgi:hypothetical protein
VRLALEEAGVKILPGPFLDFYDPWGNRVEIVGYQGIQFSMAPNVLRGMGMAPPTRSRLLPVSYAVRVADALRSFEPPRPGPRRSC